MSEEQRSEAGCSAGRMPAEFHHGLLSQCDRWRVAAAAVVLAALATPAHAQSAAVLYRLFLGDGTSVVSYGEYARVNDQVVFSLPLGSANGEPRLQLVSLPARTVDWEKTDRYADAARFTTYLQTRAESDFALMTSEVARVLNEIALTPDPAKRLQIAEYARRTLVDFPRFNYGYRVHDVGQMVGLLDEVIGDLRAAAGGKRFDLSFVAVTEPPPSAPMLPPPTVQQTIEHALAVAKLTESPIERLSLLQTAVALIGEHHASLPVEWRGRARVEAQVTIARELAMERHYRDLTRGALARADAGAARADVRGVEAIIRDVRRRDEQLGKGRPDVVNGLVAALDAKLEATRRLRVIRDQWLMRRDAYRRYERAVRLPVQSLVKVSPWLDDIKALAGPDPKGLDELQRRVTSALAVFGPIRPPDGLESVHRLLESALRFAQHAADLRRQAVVEANLRSAWDASSAAAAAMMMLARVREDVGRALVPPELK